jgi:UDP-N-acetylglucosamine 2-epimerase (non-hydrolysing)
MMTALGQISRELPLLFPMHPRTRQRIAAAKIAVSPTVALTEPIGYLDFLALQEHAVVVITDSGGVQEETTYLGIPCLTLRENTERPITIDLGTNLLLGNDLDRLQREVRNILAGRGKKGSRPPLWDGKASDRIADAILSVSGCVVC